MGTGRGQRFGNHGLAADAAQPLRLACPRPGDTGDKAPCSLSPRAPRERASAASLALRDLRDPLALATRDARGLLGPLDPQGPRDPLPFLAPIQYLVPSTSNLSLDLPSFVPHIPPSYPSVIFSGWATATATHLVPHPHPPPRFPPWPFPRVNDKTQIKSPSPLLHLLPEGEKTNSPSRSQGSSLMAPSCAHRSLTHSFIQYAFTEAL